MQRETALRKAEAATRLNLPQTTVDQIARCYYDRIIEKHEGPESWESALANYEVAMFDVQGYSVLFPRDREHHPNITILRCIPSLDQQELTIFLKDITFVQDPEDEAFWSGFLAICEKFANENFYLTTVYHEWFIIDNQAILNHNPREE